ncbi:MAG: ISNCY family transposase [Candidatus Thorarchaeota archaeon]
MATNNKEPLDWCINPGDGKSNRKADPAIKEAILKRYEQRYLGFGPTFAMEKLREEQFSIHAETLRIWLMEAGLWQRHRKRSPYRQRREPKKRFGEMVQLDGSHHRWFEDRVEEYSCLMSMVDDATKTTHAVLAKRETTETAMRLLWGWFERYGIPISLYCDRKNAYVVDREPTPEEQLEGKEPLTAFGKACEKLGIEIITAYSPQAKGRVERRHGVFQDRFVKELRLQGISSIDAANDVREGGFLEDLNRRFTGLPIDPQDAHVKIHKRVDLRTIFCFEETRTVGNDWVVQYDNRYFQLLQDKKLDIRPKTKVTIAEWLDGFIHILHQRKEVPYEEINPQVLQKVRMGRRIAEYISMNT